MEFVGVRGWLMGNRFGFESAIVRLGIGTCVRQRVEASMMVTGTYSLVAKEVGVWA